VPRIVIIVGERSGDQLAGGLITALRRHYPDAVFEGITGPEMRSAGCESWGDYSQLAIMGIFEVLRHLPRLWRLNHFIQKRLRANPPDILIGVDAPDFNLRLEKFARQIGIPTVQYVCPSVWAWRQSRVKTLKAACDLVLCLLPFEKKFLELHAVSAIFVGHPMADQIIAAPDEHAARGRLGIADVTTLALLPGSRMGEATLLAPVFAEAAAWVKTRIPDIQFVTPAASPAIGQVMLEEGRRAGILDKLTIIDGQAREVMAAADAVLLASGTATLETMLVKRPMVVAYKASPVTVWLLRVTGIVKVTRFSLPNLLAETDLVPELMQEDATGPGLGAAVLHQLQDSEASQAMLSQFDELGALLRRNASVQAARGIVELLEKQ
jgi:lipid-A-disaccharide synthase